MNGKIVKSNQNTYLDSIKSITNILIKPKMNLNDLENAIAKYKLDSSFIRRLINYTLGMPGIIIYLNKYINKLGQMDLISFIKTLRYILSMNNCLDSRNFMYVKRTNVPAETLQPTIIKLLDEYFTEIYHLKLNYKELRFFYQLFLIGEIRKSDIYEIDKLLHNDDTTVKLPDFQPQKQNEVQTLSVEEFIKKLKERPSVIEKLSTELYDRKLKYCQNNDCIQREFVEINGNVVDLDKVDVLILNLFPTIEDYKSKRIFKENTSIRNGINNFPKGTQWILVNLIPCAFKSKSDIGNVSKVQSQLGLCKFITDECLQSFKPKFTILIGEEVFKKVSNLDFNESVGKLIDRRYLPVYHPNSLKRPNLKLKDQECWKNINEILNRALKPVIDDTIPPINAQDLDTRLELVNMGGKNPSTLPKKYNKKDLLFLDVRELKSGEILVIFTDPDGNKVYETHRDIQPGYIKYQNFKECGILSKEIDAEFTMNQKQKRELLKLLRTKQQDLKNV